MINASAAVLVMAGRPSVGYLELLPADPPSIEPYRLLGRLDASGMGQVYLGLSPAGKMVALKVIPEELVADPEFRTWFTRGMAAARRVEGQYTAAVVDADRRRRCR